MLDVTSMEENIRVLAGFILDQRAIPEHILKSLERVQMTVPEVQKLQDKAERFDEFKRRPVPNLDYMRTTARLLLVDADYYRDRANGLREVHFFPSYSLDVIGRACQRQAEHLLNLARKYDAEQGR